MSLPHDGESDVTKTVEDDDERDPDFPAVNVVAVEVPIEPADSKVVDGGENPCGADGVVSTDVGDDGNLGRKANVGEEEAAEKRGEWATGDPETKRVEKEFVAAVGILFPTSQFIVDSKRNTLLEAFAGPCGKSDNVTIALQTKRHVEILGHVGL